MIGIVGHVQRLDMVQALAGSTGAEYVSVDDGTLGCDGNHRKVWSHLAEHCVDDWAVVLEDDAQPVEGFRAQASQALAATPTNVVSFYLGTGRPIWFEMAGRGSAQKLQPLIHKAVDTAKAEDASFILAPKLFHAVAVAIRTPLIPSMLSSVQRSPKPIDFAIGDWCVAEGHTVAYTTPSLVDHDDTETVIPRHPDGEPRLQPRKAHRVGTRTMWTSRSVDI